MLDMEKLHTLYPWHRTWRAWERGIPRQPGEQSRVETITYRDRCCQIVRLEWSDGVADYLHYHWFDTQAYEDYLNGK